MSWIEPYLFMLYDHASFNCWQLVCMVYQEQLSIELDHYSGVDPTDRHKVGELLGMATGWSPCDPNTYLALVVMGRHRDPYHVGVVVAPNKILHVQDKCTASVQSPETLRLNGFTRLKYYQHAKNLPRS